MEIVYLIIYNVVYLTNDYKFTGAEFDGVKCQNDTESETATAVASIKNGFISNIHITSKGFGYTKAPLISILGGNGADASAKCIIDQKNKCLKKIQLISRGRNYTSTPTIIIENQNQIMYVNYVVIIIN